MFEAQSRGQPKLVYARASNNDEVGRDQEGDMTSYVRNLVARMAKEEMNSQQPIKQKQLTEIGIHAGGLQANQQGNNKYSNEDKAIYLQREQLYQSKLSDRGLSAEEKRPSGNNISARKENHSVCPAQEMAEKITGSKNRYLQPSSVLNDKSISPEIEIVQIRADQRYNFEKFANGTKLNKEFSLSPGAIDGSLKSAGSHSSANRVEKVTLISTSDGKAKTAGLSSVAAPVERALTVATSAERLNSSSISSPITAEKMVMILSHSKPAQIITPSAAITTSESVTPISQTPTSAVGKTETVSSLSKTTTVERVTHMLSVSTTASGGKLGNVSSLFKATSTDRMLSVSPTSINLAKKKMETVTPLSKASTVGMITPISSNPTSSAIGKQEIATGLLKHSAFERSAPVSSGVTSGKHETTSILSKAATVDILGKLTAVDSESASHVSNTNFDQTSYNSLKQSPLTPKQIYSSSPTPTSKDNAQKKSSVLQTEHSMVPLSQRHVIETQSQQTNDTKLHATTIQVHRNPQKRQQISVGQGANSDLPLNSCSPISNSNTVEALARSSSHIDYNQDSEPVRTSSDSFSPIASSSPPKSILKNSTSFDKGDTLIISGHHNEESVDYCDFGPQRTATIESFSVKKQVQNLFKTRISSPTPQLKRHVSMDTETAIPELDKEGKGLKKSVTFNSKVRLHLENDESAIDNLSVDE